MSYWRKRCVYRPRSTYKTPVIVGSLLDGYAVLQDGSNARYRLHSRFGSLCIYPHGYGKWKRCIRHDAGGYYIWLYRKIYIKLRIVAGRHVS